jgi:hypothetical protein
MHWATPFCAFCALHLSVHKPTALSTTSAAAAAAAVRCGQIPQAPASIGLPPATSAAAAAATATRLVPPHAAAGTAAAWVMHHGSRPHTRLRAHVAHQQMLRRVLHLLLQVQLPQILLLPQGQAGRTQPAAEAHTHMHAHKRVQWRHADDMNAITPAGRSTQKPLRCLVHNAAVALLCLLISCKSSSSPSAADIVVCWPAV